MKSANYCEFQSVYRKGYSTETALLRVVNDIQRAAGNDQCTALLALDISSAFDAVDHATLTDSAPTVFGIHDVALDWLRSFFTERTQQIAVGSEKSAVLPCASGVPQRSVLGPILFGMYCTCHLSAMSSLNTTFNTTNMQMTCNYSFQSLRPSNIRIQQSGLVT